MKVKCYAIFDNSGNEVLSEYANPSQKNFLSFELSNAVRRLKRSQRIEFEHTSNGVWYCKQSETSISAFIQLDEPTFSYYPQRQPPSQSHPPSSPRGFSWKQVEELPKKFA